MTRIRLIHWNPNEIESRVRSLHAAGFGVDHTPFTPASIRAPGAPQPDIFVIDLSRSPSQGRDTGIYLRKQRELRTRPLIFAGGTRAQVQTVRDLLPDALFCAWTEIEETVAYSLRHAPHDPVVPESVFAAYKGTALPKKLGIRAGMTVVARGGPSRWKQTLGSLPDGVKFKRAGRAKRDLTLWFVRSQAELEANLERMLGHAEGGRLWILWPKKASGVRSDLSQQVVRELGLRSGMVDFKICAFDETWSGLRFSLRK
jgi:hypothetical protein